MEGIKEIILSCTQIGEFTDCKNCQPSPNLWKYLYAENVVYTIPGVPKKAERRIFSTLRSKSIIFFTSLTKASSAEENETTIIEFGWVILILCPFLETQSFSNFARFLRPMSEELCREWPFIWCFGEVHWSVSTKETM